MSSAVSIAAAAVTANQAQVQMAVAARMAKTNASSEQSVVQLIEAANASMQQLVQSLSSSGIGANLDISA